MNGMALDIDSKKVPAIKGKNLNLPFHSHLVYSRLEEYTEEYLSSLWNMIAN